MSRTNGTSPISTLYVTQWFPPEPAEVPLGIAEALAKRGHHVNVLTGIPNYPLGKVYPGYRATQSTTEIVRGLAIRRAPLVPSHDSSAVRRITNYVSWAFSATLVGFRLLRRADVALVYASPATAALPAMIWRRITRTPYVLLIQDIWPDSVFATGFLKNGPVSRASHSILSWFCARAYKSAAHVVVISPSAIDLLASRGVSHDKLSLVYNWTDVPDPSHVEASDARLELGLPEHAFVISYAGNHGPAQGLDVVIRAANEVRDIEDIHVMLVGDGLQAPALRELVQSLECPNVTMAGPMPHEKMPLVRGASDVQLVSLTDDPLFAVTMPSKVQSILSSGTSMITIASGDAATVAEESCAGWAVAPGDHQQLAAVFREAHREGRENLKARGRAGREYYRRNMSEAVGGDRLDQILRAATHNSRRDNKKGTSP